MAGDFSIKYFYYYQQEEERLVFFTLERDLFLTLTGVTNVRNAEYNRA
jgi:hypothetical protein